MSELKNNVYRSTSKLISELNAIAKISYGDKWNISGVFIQKQNVMTKISRTFWYANESRGSTITYIESLLDRSFSAFVDIDSIVGQSVNQKSDVEKFSDLRGRLLTALISAKNGIINLRGAYEDDEDTKARLVELAEDLVVKSKDLFQKKS